MDHSQGPPSNIWNTLYYLRVIEWFGFGMRSAASAVPLSLEWPGNLICDRSQAEALGPSTPFAPAATGTARAVSCSCEVEGATCMAWLATHVSVKSFCGGLQRSYGVFKARLPVKAPSLLSFTWLCLGSRPAPHDA